MLSYSSLFPVLSVQTTKASHFVICGNLGIEETFDKPAHQQQGQKQVLQLHHYCQVPCEACRNELHFHLHIVSLYSDNQVTDL